LEVILGRLHATYFGAVVISAVAADVVAHFFEQDVAAFSVPEYALVSPGELGLYTLLGLMAAVGAVAFTRVLYLSEDLWDKIRLPEYVKPVVGGVLLGAIGLLTFKVDGFPRVFGVGYDTISTALFGQFAIQVTLALLFLKVLATILTLGSGGSGGIFAPSLFMGAMLGSSFGQVAHQLFPQSTAPSGAYALVGMAAFFGGAAHAPVTAILILFEMTGDYRIILPLMLATVISTLASRVLSRESIYTLKLSRRGVHLEEGQDTDVMQGVTVGEAMTMDPDSVPPDMSLEDLAQEFARTHHHGYTVVDEKNCLVGVVSIRDYERILASGRLEDKTVADIATTEGLLVAYPDEPMWQALRRLAARELSRLPVVERGPERRLVGVVRRADIIRAYNHAIVNRARHQHHVAALRLGRLDGAGFARLAVSADAPAAGRRVDEVELPERSLIVSVRRGRKLHVAHGYTELQPGDLVTVFADDDDMQTVRQILAGGTPPSGR
jgi:CIC family chloride channel protein